jgi:alkanesulfonate monooxygenase SsuD/methylene tetrahydromethanopterin reductase-like flavin-dependent oxidoreductase (luciferase family)
MKIGVGLPAAVPGALDSATPEWAARAEELGFESVGVLDRLVYDNLDPLIALAAAAACTERVELLTTVLTVPVRQNAIVLAKQIASVDRISGGRVTAGLALGGWPEDYEASGLPTAGRGARFDALVATMRQVWAGEVTGASGPIPPLADGHPALLFGGFVDAAFRRAASLGVGWVAPFFGLETLLDGASRVRDAWGSAAREGAPRVVAERYFCLAPDADRVADEYISHYYGAAYFDGARADTLTSPELLGDELVRLADAGCTDLLLLPCSGDLSELERLAGAIPDTARMPSPLGNAGEQSSSK